MTDVMSNEVKKNLPMWTIVFTNTIMLCVCNNFLLNFCVLILTDSYGIYTNKMLPKYYRKLFSTQAKNNLNFMKIHMHDTCHNIQTKPTLKSYYHIGLLVN